MLRESILWQKPFSPWDPSKRVESLLVIQWPYFIPTAEKIMPRAVVSHPQTGWDLCWEGRSLKCLQTWWEVLWKAVRNYLPAPQRCIFLYNCPSRSWNLRDSSECGTERGIKAGTGQLSQPYVEWKARQSFPWQCRYLSQQQNCCTLCVMTWCGHSASI